MKAPVDCSLRRTWWPFRRSWVVIKEVEIDRVFDRPYIWGLRREHDWEPEDKTTMEALRLKVDSLQLAIQQLEAETARLRDEHPEHPEAATLEETRMALSQSQQEKEQLVEELRELRQRLHETQEDSVRLAEQWEAAEALLRQKEQDAEQDRVKTELAHYKALEWERRKWEEREAVLLQQLQVVQRQGLARSQVTKEDKEGSQATVESKPQGTGIQMKRSQVTKEDKEGSQVTVESKAQGVRGQGMEEIYGGGPGINPLLWSTAVLAQQLPPISKFTGETRDDSEVFQEWLEQFEMVASICRWDEKAKLVNLTTRLGGQAYTFYRSCTMTQRNDYALLKAELLQRFTPVRIVCAE